jgi:hypothetical protein
MFGTLEVKPAACCIWKSYLILSVLDMCFLLRVEWFPSCVVDASDLFTMSLSTEAPPALGKEIEQGTTHPNNHLLFNPSKGTSQRGDNMAVSDWCTL